MKSKMLYHAYDELHWSNDQLTCELCDASHVPCARFGKWKMCIACASAIIITSEEIKQWAEDKWNEQA